MLGVWASKFTVRLRVKDLGFMGLKVSVRFRAKGMGLTGLKFRISWLRSLQVRGLGFRVYGFMGLEPATPLEKVVEYLAGQGT